jgi:hypothetical protein
MGLQTQRLTMAGLSVDRDTPPNPLQPPLVPGIHLRWAFEREAGFPWHGFYLFRREHRVADRTSVRLGLAGLSLGPTSSSTLSVPGATFTSDRTLVATDDFAPPGAVELDLSGRGFLRFAPDRLASEVELRVGFAQDGEVTATIHLQGVAVESRTLRGRATAELTVTFELDAISAIEFSGGPARLIDVAYVEVDTGLLAGWQATPRFSYPLALPVAHLDYPANRGPTDIAASETAALPRITYGEPTDWGGPRFAALHDELVKLVAGGPASTAMAQRSFDVQAEPGPPPLKMPAQRPLDLVLLAALEPAAAQLLGLYWADETVRPDVSYDFMVVADGKGVLGGAAQSALTWLNQNGFDDVDAFIVFNKRQDDPAPPLAPPGDVRAYALPGAGLGAGAAETGVGLRWDRGLAPRGGVLPGKPVLYHLWRADLGPSPPADPPSTYNLITAGAPVLVAPARPSKGRPPQRPEDWPRFPLFAIDGGRPEGWFSYQVSGVDVFGRHSANSTPGAWYQWAPLPAPRPWYYRDPAVESVVHPFAVGLLDKVAPPAPTAVEAYALDPGDPTVLHDTAYSAWRAQHDSMFGLRVRWTWTTAHMQQAPDTREFRIYFHPGHLNAMPGRVTSITAAGATETIVATDIANTRPANAYVGARLVIGPHGFPIVGSEADTPLRLRVGNLGPATEIQPVAREFCTVALPSNHALARDYGAPTAWQTRYHVVGFDEGGTFSTTTGGDRRYEVFLPVSGDRTELPLTTSAADPIVYAHVSVSAADDKSHTEDDPKWAGTQWGGPQRFGNEGPVGQPATIFRVRRTPPDPPRVPPADSEAVFATAADYHGRSFFTYRWLPATRLGTHIFRALDDTLFKVDWTRTQRPMLTADDTALFPDPAVESRWTVAKRTQVAAELNALTTLKSSGASLETALARYRALSNDALRVLAGLPGNEAAFSQLTIQPLDPDEPANQDRRGPDSPPTYVPSAALRAHLDTLDGRTASRYFYRAAYIDGAQNRSALSLAGPPIYLPQVVPPSAPVVTKVLGGDRQITLRWTSGREAQRCLIYRTEDAARVRDVRLLGTPLADLPSAVLLVRGGEVDLGVATGATLVEHVYRAEEIDPDEDPLSTSAATDYLSAPVVPTSGRVRGLLASDGTEVVAVYRDAANVLQRTPVPGRGAQWVDSPRPGAVTAYYALVAVREVMLDGSARRQASELSRSVAGRAYDISAPDPAQWETAEWVRSGATLAISLVWSGVAEEDESLLERHGVGALVWERLVPWATGRSEYRDENVEPAQTYRYRVKVRRANGLSSVSDVAAVEGN